MVTFRSSAAAEAWADAAIDELTREGVAGFEAWWRSRVQTINRLAVDHPRQYERVAQAVERVPR